MLLKRIGDYLLCIDILRFSSEIAFKDACGVRGVKEFSLTELLTGGVRCW